MIIANTHMHPGMIQAGSEPIASVGSGTTRTITITYPKPFSAAPFIVASMNSTGASINAYGGSKGISVKNINGTNFQVVSYANTSAQPAMRIDWIAVLCRWDDS